MARQRIRSAAAADGEMPSARRFHNSRQCAEITYDTLQCNWHWRKNPHTHTHTLALNSRTHTFRKLRLNTANLVVANCWWGYPATRWRSFQPIGDRRRGFLLGSVADLGWLNQWVTISRTTAQRRVHTDAMRCGSMSIAHWTEGGCGGICNVTGGGWWRRGSACGAHAHTLRVTVRGD